MIGSRAFSLVFSLTAREATARTLFHHRPLRPPSPPTRPPFHSAASAAFMQKRDFIISRYYNKALRNIFKMSAPPTSIHKVDSDRKGPDPGLTASHLFLTSSDPDRDEGVLQSLPLGTNGLSLGLCGLAGVCGELERRGVSPFLTTVPYWVAMGCAALLFVTFTARLVVSPRARLRMEATTPQLCFAYGAYQMTYLFVLFRVVKLACPACVGPGIHAGAVLQLVVIGLFLAGCWRTGLKPEPLWNPPTINCAVTAIVGIAALGANHWLVRSSLWYALALQVLFVPWQVWRTVRDPDIAPNCAVSMMQAPCSLNTLTFGVVRRGAKLARLGPVFLGDARAEQVLAHALFAAATLVFWLTLYCLWARRGPIRERGFDLSFVALTFPSCSTAIAGLQYASPPADAAASGADGTLLLLLRIYAFVVAGCVALTVVAVALGCAKIAVDELRRRAQ